LAENAISVAFEATADTAQAESQMAQMGASIDGTMQRTAKSVNATAVQMGKTIAESLKQAGATAEDAAVVYGKLGMAGGQAAQEITAAFGTMPPTANAATAAVGRTTNEIRQSTAAAIMLERQVGVQLPRGINAMLARSELIGPALQYAFSAALLIYFAQNVDKIYESIKNAALAMGGFGEEAQKAFRENIKASDDALTHFHGLTTEMKLATGHFLIAQTEARLVGLDMAKATAESAMSLTKMFVLLGAAAGTYGASLIPVIKSMWDLHGVNSEIAKLQQQHIAQLEELDKLEKELHKEQERGAKAEETAARQREREEEAAQKRAEAQARKVAEATAAMNALAQAELREADALAVSDSKRAAALKTYEAHIQKINQTIEADRRAGTLTVEIEQAADRAKLLARQNYDAKLEELDAKDAERNKREIDRLIRAHQQRFEKEQEGFARLVQIEASKTLELAKDEQARIRIREQRELFDLEALKQSVLRLATTEKQKTAIIAQAERDRQLITAAAEKAIAASLSKTGMHQALKQQRLDWQMLSQGMRTAISEMTGSLAGWGGVATRIFDQMANQIIRQIELDQEQAIEHQATQVSMATSTLTAMKQTAFYKVYWHTAKAIGELASLDFRAAALDFAAAGLYGFVAGMQVAAMVGAIGGGGAGAIAGGKAGSSSTATTSTTTKKTVAEATAERGPTINVYIDGVISSDNLDQVLQQINDRVQGGDVHLISTTTLAPPIVRS
jgi:hypothetical protein